LDFSFGKTRRIIMKKKLLALISVATLATGLLAGCGSTASDSSTASSSQAESSVAADSSSTAASTASTESVPEDNVIKVAATAVPHAEILEVAKPILAEQGYDLEIQIFDDYVQPNEVVESGDFDANYFQHIPYLESFNEEKGTHLVNAGGIHYEPFGLYPGKETDLANIEGATIAIPNDTTNEARALLLLQDNGYITLKDGVGLTATVNDIVENPYNIEIVELEAAQVPRTLPDVSFGILNGNYAMEAGLTVADDALLYESADSEAAATYVNVIAVKEGNENLPKIQALVDVLKSDAIKEFINENYNGGVIPYL
jgi:D-methionine transport system substrate-binding protein